jgi:hypothetical protein
MSFAKVTFFRFDAGGSFDTSGPAPIATAATPATTIPAIAFIRSPSLPQVAPRHATRRNMIIFHSPFS